LVAVGDIVHDSEVTTLSQCHQGEKVGGRLLHYATNWTKLGVDKWTQFQTGTNWNSQKKPPR
jgi:hypothetical protein